VQRVVAQERVSADTFCYDTTNFFTFIGSTNTRPTLPRRGHNKRKRHDLRQLGLALAVARDGQLPLFHLLYDGDRPDMRTFRTRFLGQGIGDPVASCGLPLGVRTGRGWVRCPSRSMSHSVL
jgi:hypothetical protein